MKLRLSRQRRHQIARNSAAVERVTATDDRFFQRFPEREYRIRRMSQAELASAAAVLGASPVDRPRTAHFTLIKQIAPGIRIRAHVVGPKNEDGNGVTDEQCRWLWEHCASTPQLVSVEKEVRDAFLRAGGAE